MGWRCCRAFNMPAAQTSSSSSIPVDISSSIPFFSFQPADSSLCSIPCANWVVWVGGKFRALDMTNI